MGGLRKQHAAHLRGPSSIATLAIAGMPPLSGFFSKDEILLAARSRPARRTWARRCYGDRRSSPPRCTAFYMCAHVV